MEEKINVPEGSEVSYKVQPEKVSINVVALNTNKSDYIFQTYHLIDNQKKTGTIYGKESENNKYATYTLKLDDNSEQPTKLIIPLNESPKMDTLIGKEVKLQGEFHSNWHQNERDIWTFKESYYPSKIDSIELKQVPSSERQINRNDLVSVIEKEKLNNNQKLTEIDYEIKKDSQVEFKDNLVYKKLHIENEKNATKTEFSVFKPSKLGEIYITDDVKKDDKNTTYNIEIRDLNDARYSNGTETAKLVVPNSEVDKIDKYIGTRCIVEGEAHFSDFLSEDSYIKTSLYVYPKEIQGVVGNNQDVLKTVSDSEKHIDVQRIESIGKEFESLRKKELESTISTEKLEHNGIVISGKLTHLVKDSNGGYDVKIQVDNDKVFSLTLPRDETKQADRLTVRDNVTALGKLDQTVQIKNGYENLTRDQIIISKIGTISSDINEAKVKFAGVVVKDDPTIKQIPNVGKTASMIVAHNETKEGIKITNWIEAKAVGDKADKIEGLKKGDLVQLEGNLRVDKFEKNNTQYEKLNLVVFDVKKLDIEKVKTQSFTEKLTNYFKKDKTVNKEEDWRKELKAEITSMKINEADPSTKKVSKGR